MTYTRNTSIFYKYSKRRKYNYIYGMGTITNYYLLLRRSRFLFLKSELLHIYYIKPDKYFLISPFQELKFFFENSNFFLKIINIYIRF